MGRQSPEYSGGRNERLMRSTSVIVFVGPEGAGKTSQARMFADKIGLPYLTYGDVFREAAVNDHTVLGDECRRVFREHDYIDPEVHKVLISKELNQEKYRSGLVIDGSFRVPGEVESFEELLSLAGIKNPAITVFYLRIPGWEAFRRTLMERKRTDDTIEGMIGRLSAFHNGLGQRTSEIRKRTKNGSWKFEIIMALERIDMTARKILEKFNEN